MTRGESTQSKVHYKGSNDDFIVIVDDAEAYKQWLNDSSVPLAHFVSSFKVFITHKYVARALFPQLKPLLPPLTSCPTLY